MFSNDRIEECLAYLRQADDMLMDDGELLLAARLSLVIEALAARLDIPHQVH